MVFFASSQRIGNWMSLVLDVLVSMSQTSSLLPRSLVTSGVYRISQVLYQLQSLAFAATIHLAELRNLGIGMKHEAT
jgi:hypothetical protein